MSMLCSLNFSSFDYEYTTAILHLFRIAPGVLKLSSTFAYTRHRPRMPQKVNRVHPREPEETVRMQRS